MLRQRNDMEEGRVKLKVMGLSYNQIHDGAYALMLAEVNGPYRIPIVIGAAEAQSIAVVLEGVNTPRPLTHDLFTAIGHVFGIRPAEVFIYSFEDGIFASTITFENENGDRAEIDSRTSDAIAIALRTNAPIYTTRDILERTGFILEKHGPGTGKASGHSASGMHVEIEWNEDGSNEIEEEILGIQTPSYENLELEELYELLARAVDSEDYETAKEIKDIIDRKSTPPEAL